MSKLVFAGILVVALCCGVLDAGSYGKEFLECSLWGSSHGTNFDDQGFDVQGYCSYTLVTTKCSNYKNSGVMPFSVEIERSGDDRTLLALAVIVKIYGQTYKMMRGRMLLVNGALAYKPYKSPSYDVTVGYHGSTMMFNTKFLQVHWDGYEHIDVYLCDEYKGQVCGLCGNADGNPDNDFIGTNSTYMISESKYAKYKEWTDLWQVEDSYKSCKSVGLASTIRCNQEKFKTNEYCGLITSIESPWSLCLSRLSQSVIDKIYDSCLSDMCQYQLNKVQQQKAKCDNFERLSQACYDLGITNFEWRNKSECQIYCSENEHYGITKTCTKSCLNPSGKDCGSVVYRSGCYCDSGYILDSRETCVLYKDCGCKSLDGSQIINVGESYNGPDCSKTYYCEACNSNCLSKSLQCNRGSVCGINEDYKYACIECPVDTVYLNGSCIAEQKLTSTKRTTRRTTEATTTYVKPRSTYNAESEMPTKYTKAVSYSTKTVYEKYKDSKPELSALFNKFLKEYMNEKPKYSSVPSTYTTKYARQNSTYSTKKYATAAYQYYTSPAVRTQLATLPASNFPNQMFTTPFPFTFPTQVSTLGVTFPSVNFQTQPNNNLAQFYAQLYGQMFTTPFPFTQVSTLGVTFPTFTFPPNFNMAMMYGGQPQQGFTTPFPFNTQVSTLGVTFPSFTFPTGSNGGYYGQQQSQGGFPFNTQVSTLGVTFPSFTFPTGSNGGFYGQQLPQGGFPFNTQVSTLGVTFPTFTLPSGFNMAQLYGQMFTTPFPFVNTQVSTLGVTFPTFTLPSGMNMGMFYGGQQQPGFTTPFPFINTQVSTLGVTFPSINFQTAPPAFNMAMLYGQMFQTTPFPFPFTQVSTLGVTFPSFTLPTGNFGPFPFTQVSTLGVSMPPFTFNPSVGQPNNPGTTSPSQPANDYYTTTAKPYYTEADTYEENSATSY